MKKYQLTHDCLKTTPLWESEEQPEGRNKLDQYFTPPECTHSFLNWLDDLEIEPMANWYMALEWGSSVLEPCAGENYIADVIRDRFPEGGVYTADLDPTMPVDRPGADATKLDPEHLRAFDFVISNPPYSHAAPIVRRMTKYVPRVAMYLRLSFLEYCQDRTRPNFRPDILDKLSAVLILPRHRFINGKKGNDSLPCAWFVWDVEHEGPPTIHYVSKGEFKAIQDQIKGQETLFPVVP